MTPQTFIRAATAPAPAVVMSLVSALSSGGQAMAVTTNVLSDSATGCAYFGDVPARRQSGWTETRRKLSLYAALKDGWDGDAARRVPPSVIDRAQNVLAHFAAAGLSEPEVDLDTNGELSFIWDDDVVASVTLAPTGEVLAYAYVEGDAAAFRHSSKALNFDDLEPVVNAIKRA